MEFDEHNKYTSEFNEQSFWNKVRKYGTTAGRRVVEPALIMYYCMKDKETPWKAKMIILSALGYFILPTDAIPDISPLVGFTDDLGALIAAYEMVKVYAKPEHIEQAKSQADKWFAGA
jgi:uncharacterized membrane protein YkvA (DUF1232 family)